MGFQPVVNNPLGNYPVIVDKNSDNHQRQAVGIDIGTVTGDVLVESRVSASNPLPVTGTIGPGSVVTVDNAAGASAVNIQDGGNSITVDGAVTISNASGASAVNIQDGGNSITVDGTVTASPAATVSTTGNITASAQTIPVTLGEQKFVTLDISGTYGSVALAFEISLDGTNYRAIAMARVDANTVETVTGTISSTTRTWETHCGAATHFRVRSTAWASGTMAVRINNSASDAEPAPTTQTHAVTMTSTTLTAVTPGTSAANLGKQIDLVVGANDVGVAALARRRNTPISGGGVSADGDYNIIQSNLFGGVYTALIDTAGQQQTFTTTTPGAGAVGMVVRNLPSGTQGVNVAQINGTTTDVNAGTLSAGTQRVTLATDQTTLTNDFAAVRLKDAAGNSLVSTTAAPGLTDRALTVQNVVNYTASNQSLTTAGTSTTTISGYEQIEFTFSGTYSNASLVFEVNYTGTSWTSVYCSYGYTPSSGASSYFATNGTYTFRTPTIMGVGFKVRLASITSGTVDIAFKAYQTCRSTPIQNITGSVSASVSGTVSNVPIAAYRVYDDPILLDFASIAAGAGGWVYAGTMANGWNGLQILNYTDEVLDVSLDGGNLVAYTLAPKTQAGSIVNTPNILSAAAYYQQGDVYVRYVYAAPTVGDIFVNGKNFS